MAEPTQYRCALCGSVVANGSVKAHYQKIHPKATEIKARKVETTNKTTDKAVEPDTLSTTWYTHDR